jgi:hypothetical protein
MVREDYTFRQPNGQIGIYEEFHTGSAVFYSIACEKRQTAMVAFATVDVPLFARILANHEQVQLKGEIDCFDVFFGPFEIGVPDLKETLEERAHLQRNLQQCDAGKHASREVAYLSLGDAIKKYADAFETQCQIHSQRTYTDVHNSDFRAYFKSFILKPLNYSETEKGKMSLLEDFERFMESYPVDEHVTLFCETANKNSKSPLLNYYARVFDDLKKEKYERVSDRLKKVSSRLQSV